MRGGRVLGAGRPGARLREMNSATVAAVCACDKQAAVSRGRDCSREGRGGARLRLARSPRCAGKRRWRPRRPWGRTAGWRSRRAGAGPPPRRGAGRCAAGCTRHPCMAHECWAWRLRCQWSTPERKSSRMASLVARSSGVRPRVVWAKRQPPPTRTRVTTAALGGQHAGLCAGTVQGCPPVGRAWRVSLGARRGGLGAAARTPRCPCCRQRGGACAESRPCRSGPCPRRPGAAARTHASWPLQLAIQRGVPPCARPGSGPCPRRPGAAARTPCGLQFMQATKRGVEPSSLAWFTSTPAAARSSRRVHTASPRAAAFHSAVLPPGPASWFDVHLAALYEHPHDVGVALPDRAAEQAVLARRRRGRVHATARERLAHGSRGTARPSGRWPRKRGHNPILSSNHYRNTAAANLIKDAKRHSTATRPATGQRQGRWRWRWCGRGGSVAVGLRAERWRGAAAGGLAGHDKDKLKVEVAGVVSRPAEGDSGKRERVAM